MTSESSSPTATEPSLCHRGGCHCGRVRFAAFGPAHLEVLDCNCSICRLSGFLHWIVPKAQFQLLTEWSALSTYRFGTGIAQHYFCTVCGIKSFYVPRSNPDGIGINVRCLDQDPARSLHIRPFDGQHWEQHAARLGGLSRSL